MPGRGDVEMEFVLLCRQRRRANCHSYEVVLCATIMAVAVMLISSSRIVVFGRGVGSMMYRYCSDNATFT